MKNQVDVKLAKQRHPAFRGPFILGLHGINISVNILSLYFSTQNENEGGAILHDSSVLHCLAFSLSALLNRIHISKLESISIIL